MPDTAITPFREDIARAKALVAHAKSLPSTTNLEKSLRDDILRSGWMFAVGAMDAYFCDAYTDLITATLQSKSYESAILLPDFVGKVKIPVTAVLVNYPVRQNWKWRMAAREMMADQNALQIKIIKSWFNHFCRHNRKLFRDVIPVWIVKPGATARLFGIAPANYTPADQDAANEVLLRRFEYIVQRRHDCIHTCDRPANQPQPVNSAGTVANVIKDIEFIVEQSDPHIDAEFRTWLLGCGFSTVTVNQVGY
jgi:hypothetical protein